MKIFCGNLDYTTTKQDLHDLFSDVGTVTDTAVIADRETGRSRGFGFVTFSSEDEAKKAIDRFHGYLLGRREIVVNMAERQGQGGRPPGGSGGRRDSRR